MPTKNSSGSDTGSECIPCYEKPEGGRLSQSDCEENDSDFLLKDNTSFSNTDSDTCLHCTTGARKAKDSSARKKRAQKKKSDLNPTDLENKKNNHEKEHRQPDHEKEHRQPNYEKEQSESKEIQISTSRCTQKQISQSSLSSCGLCRRPIIDNVSTGTAPNVLYPKLVNRKLEQASDSSLEASESSGTVSSIPSFPQKSKKSQHHSKTQILNHTSVDSSQTLQNKPTTHCLVPYGIQNQEHLDRRLPKRYLPSKIAENSNFSSQSIVLPQTCLQNSLTRQSQNAFLDDSECFNNHKKCQSKNCNCSDETSSIVITLTLDTGKSDKPEIKSTFEDPQTKDTNYSIPRKFKTEDIVGLSKYCVPTTFEEPHSGKYLKCVNSAYLKHQSTRLPNKTVSSLVKSGSSQLKAILPPPNYCDKTSGCSLGESCHLKDTLPSKRSSNWYHSRMSCFKSKLNPQHMHSAVEQDFVPSKTEGPHCSKQTIPSSQFQTSHEKMEAALQKESDDKRSISDVSYNENDDKLSQLSGEDTIQAPHECHKTTGTASQELSGSQAFDHDYFCKCGRVPQYGLFPNEPVAQAVTSQGRKDSCIDKKAKDYQKHPTKLCRHKLNESKNELAVTAQNFSKVNKCANVSNRFSSEEDMCKLMIERENFNKTQAYFESGSRKKAVHQRNEIDWIKKEALKEEETDANACPLIVKENGDTAVGSYFGIKLKDRNAGPKEGHNSNIDKEINRQSCCGVQHLSCQGMGSHNLDPHEELWKESKISENKTCSDQVQETPKTDEEQICAFCEYFYKFGQPSELH